MISKIVPELSSEGLRQCLAGRAATWIYCEIVPLWVPQLPPNNAFQKHMNSESASKFESKHLSKFSITKQWVIKNNH